jgi:hypothetical protein
MSMRPGAGTRPSPLSIASQSVFSILNSSREHANHEQDAADVHILNRCSFAFDLGN